MKIEALIDYKDCKLNKEIKKGDNLIEIYEKAGVELTKERIDILITGNDTNGNQPFVKVIEDKKKKETEVETTDKKTDNVETATIKTKKVSKKVTK